MKGLIKWKDCPVCNGTGWLTEYGDSYQLMCHARYIDLLTEREHECNMGLWDENSIPVIDNITETI